jgi:hypothetical protein
MNPRSLSRLKRPDELQLLEGNRLQAMLHAMEDNAHAKAGKSGLREKGLGFRV